MKEQSRILDVQVSKKDTQTCRERGNLYTTMNPSSRSSTSIQAYKLSGPCHLLWSTHKTQNVKMCERSPFLSFLIDTRPFEPGSKAADSKVQPTGRNLTPAGPCCFTAKERPSPRQSFPAALVALHRAPAPPQDCREQLPKLRGPVRREQTPLVSERESGHQNKIPIYSLIGPSCPTELVIKTRSQLVYYLVEAV